MAERGGVHCGAELHLSGMRSLGSGATGQRLNGAWHAADLDASEAALSAYMTAGARAFLKKAQEDHPAPHQPALTRWYTDDPPCLRAPYKIRHGRYVRDLVMLPPMFVALASRRTCVAGLFPYCCYEVRDR